MSSEWIIFGGDGEANAINMATARLITWSREGDEYTVLVVLFKDGPAFEFKGDDARAILVWLGNRGVPASQAVIDMVLDLVRGFD